MPWVRRKLRGNLVYVRANAGGEPEAGPDGRVEVVYKLAPGAKIYRAGSRNLEATGDPADDVPVEVEIELTPADDAPKKKAAAKKGAAPAAPIPDDALLIYTDGGARPNPGPMGIGVVIADDERLELSEYLGPGTNNIAELTAILRAIDSLDSTQRLRPLVIHTDSSYAIGVLSKGWKAKANQELIAELRQRVQALPEVQFVWVRGHTGHPENERCDELATAAIERRR